MAEFLSQDEIDALLDIAEQGEDIPMSEGQHDVIEEMKKFLVKLSEREKGKVQEAPKQPPSDELRIYHFGNFYMSSIQQGIQAAHAQMEIFNKYPKISRADALNKRKGHAVKKPEAWLYDWSYNWKTMICLNGGMDVHLHEIKAIVEHEDNPYPWSHFYEADEAMAGMLTNVAIVLPYKIFDGAEKLRSRKYEIDGNNIREKVRQPEPATFGGNIVKGESIGLYSDWELRFIERLNMCGMAK